MSEPQPYCGACGCYTQQPYQDDTVYCHSMWHNGRALQLSARFKPGGRHRRHTRSRKPATLHRGR